MAKWKNPISKIKLHEVNYATDKTVSYSQYATWRACNYQWYLAYAQNNAVYSQSIHTVFGTAIHNTLQYYIDYIFNISGKKADEIDLESYFKTQLTEEYKKGLVQNKNQQYSTPDELREFYEDGCEIIKAFKKDRVKWFGLRGWRLIGCEVPIIYPIAEKSNLFMKGYIDLVLYDEKYDRYYIYDIKTSTRGWGDKEKKNQTKMQQILLYKKFYSELYGVDKDKIHVEFIVVKRKVWNSPDFIVPRTQTVTPASGKTKMKQAENDFQQFLNECFTNDGKYIFDKEYPMNISKDTCTWCPFSTNGLCNKGEKKVTFFA
jgi:hypothetical protein